jgi:hypothetical protein
MTSKNDVLAYFLMHFQGVLVLLHHSGRFPKSQNSTVFRTYQRQGVVSLNFVKARSNLNGPRYLSDFSDPGSIRVNISLCWGGGEGGEEPKTRSKC